MRQGCLALAAIVIAILVAVLAVRLINKGTNVVRNPQPMRHTLVQLLEADLARPDPRPAPAVQLGRQLYPIVHRSVN
jgi:hypothetical protein